MTTILLLIGLLPVLGGDGAKAAAPSPGAPPAAVQDEAAPPEKTLPHWSGNVDVGIIQKSGNTDSINGRLDSKIQREAEWSLTTLTTWWLYEEKDSDLIERKYGTRGKYDYFLTPGRNVYAYGLGQVGSDFSGNIDVRYIAGVGGGYKWFERDDLALTTDLGASYKKEEYRTGSNDDSGNLTGTYDFLWKMTGKTTYASTFVGLMNFSDAEDILLTWVHGITTDLGYNFRGGIKYQLDWDNTPAPGAKRADHQIALTIGWTFGS